MRRAILGGRKDRTPIDDFRRRRNLQKSFNKSGEKVRPNGRIEAIKAMKGMAILVERISLQKIRRSRDEKWDMPGNTEGTEARRSWGEGKSQSSKKGNRVSGTDCPRLSGAVIKAGGANLKSRPKNDPELLGRK